MSSDLFSLQNVDFGYGNRKVLHIDKLNLPSQGIVFLIGASGIGKSTLLESIGLMSNAFLPFGPESRLRIKNKDYKPDELWRQKDDTIFKIRNELFSFIFQSTNLMPDFTIEENILMASKYDQGANNSIQNRIETLVEEMHLDADILNRYPHEISGGQKQRIAFIRALSSNFNALFADEPTGNLDMENSHALFRILEQHIHENKQMAFIVTHHLELAKEYGDMIIEIKKKDHDFAEVDLMFEKKIA